MNEKGLVDVNINSDGHSDSDWDGNVPCAVESASDGEGWYTAQESTDSDSDEVRTEGGGSDFEWQSDELVSGSDIDEVKDDFEGYGSFPTFTMPKNMDDYKWKIGTYFTEKHEFIEAIRTYALANGKSLKFVKNDNQRVSVKCLGANGECNWYAYCGYMGAVKSWQLRRKAGIFHLPSIASAG